MTFKEFAKKIIPIQIRSIIRRIEYKIFKVDNEFRNMSNSEIFDKIYKEGTWGKNIEGNPSSGSGSYKSYIIQPYIAKVSNFLLEKKPSVIVDLGCGDFNIGKNFVNYSKKYIACDVSKEILARNKKSFSALKNVDFNFLDLSRDCLPMGDVCIVRQVLQHLSNSDIEGFVDKLNTSKPYKYLLLTEHLPSNDNFKVNLDKRGGANIRMVLNSGVVLHKEPFNLIASNFYELLEVNEYGGRIKTIVYEF
jgi:hypothetical protein